MRWSSGLCGFQVPFSGTDLRGPEPNCQTFESVRPAKWQLAQFCQPSLESRSLVETVMPAGLSKWPRDEKKISLPTCRISSSVSGGGSWVVRLTASTVSLVRLTTEILRET